MPGNNITAIHINGDAAQGLEHFVGDLLLDIFPARGAALGKFERSEGVEV